MCTHTNSNPRSNKVDSKLLCFCPESTRDPKYFLCQFTPRPSDLPKLNRAFEQGSLCAKRQVAKLINIYEEIFD